MRDDSLTRAQRAYTKSKLDRTVNDGLRMGIFFLIIFGLLFFLGRARLPLAHLFTDWISSRDSGTMFHYFVSGPDPIRTLTVMTLGNVEGPLQVILLNAYCYAIGDLFPLNPATMQFPNTIFAFLTCIFAFLLGKRLFSDRFAYCFAAAFALSPWLAYTLRVPWYFNTLSCLLHLVTFYFSANLIMQPESKFYQTAAPVALFFYIWTGVDWPIYFLALGVFFWLSGEWRTVLWNPFNLLPLAAVAILTVWAAALFLKLGTGAFMYSRLLYPFFRLADETQHLGWARLWENSLLPFGAQLILSLVGSSLYLYARRKKPGLSNVDRAFLDSMCVWLLVATPILLISSGHPTYPYVIGMPSAALAALALERLRLVPLTVCALAILGVQLFFVFGRDPLGPFDQKRRVLAAACFLLEQRSDLLEEGKVHAATGGARITKGEHGAAVSAYARPPSTPLLIPLDWPATRSGIRDGAWHDRRHFVENYLGKGHIKADWLILESEALSERNIGRDFFLKLLHDASVRWIARFTESTGQVIYIGEVKQSGAVPIEEVPEMDVKALSDRYEAKYDRIGFLKHNIPFCWLRRSH